MVQDPDSHKFNNDLLANDGDRELAKRSYPGLIHVLDHYELQQLFTSYDAPANAASAPADSHRIAAPARRALSEPILFQAPVQRGTRETERARRRAQVALGLGHGRQYRRAFLGGERLRRRVRHG